VGQPILAAAALPAGRRQKTWLFVVLVVLSNTLGNFLLGIGMKQPSAGLLASLLSPWVIGGILLLIFWTLARLSLLSWADLSYVLPVTSIGYVLNALLARAFMNETLSWERWAGTALITAGTVLTGLGRPSR
jgi:drug/metabolite transporter (DMT)-like permease